MDEATTTVTITETAQLAVERAEDQVTIRAEKRAKARMALDKLRREYLEELEIARLEKAAQIIRRRRGRQESIPDDVLECILELHAGGESLTQSCEAYGIAISSFWRRSERDDDLRKRYTAAREKYAQGRVDGIWTLLRTEPDVERARIMADMARWEVSKVLPAIFGERVQLETPEGVAFSLNIGQLAVPKRETDTSSE